MGTSVLDRFIAARAKTVAPATFSVGTGTLRVKGNVDIDDGTINVGGGTLDGSGLPGRLGRTITLSDANALADR